MEEKSKTYVWGLPTRIFHWFLVLLLVGAYIAIDFNLTLHVAMGITAGILVLFRILWGLMGPRYSNFRDILPGIKRIKEFVLNIGKPGTVQAGHNPLAWIDMIGILMMVLLVVITGMLTLAQKGHTGPLASLDLPAGVHFMQYHKAAIYLLIAFVVIHLIGIAVDLMENKADSAAKSMFSGYKTGISQPDSRLNGFQKLVAFVWFVVPLIAFLLIITGPEMKIPAKKHKPGAQELKEMQEPWKHKD